MTLIVNEAGGINLTLEIAQGPPGPSTAATQAAQLAAELARDESELFSEQSLQNANLSLENAMLSKDWATSELLVESLDYSSKEYAVGTPDLGSSKDWAVKPEMPVADFEYSSKEHAIGELIPTGSSKMWANKLDFTVDSFDYSSKEYAIGNSVPTGSSRRWAIATGQNIDGVEYSAKEYAIGSFTPTGSSKDWAVKVGMTVIPNEYSSKEHAIGQTTPSGSAKMWAVKLDGPIANGEYSSKFYANQSYTFTQYVTNIENSVSTSVTSNSITLGLKTFIVQPNKLYFAGIFLQIIAALSPTNYIIAQVESYDSVTGELVVNPVQLAGNGTFSNWTIVQTARIEENGGAQIVVEDEGVTLTNSLEKLNFVGDNIAATVLNNEVTVVSNRQKISVKDEGVEISPDVVSFNFTGQGVTSTVSGNEVTVNVTASSSGGSGGFEQSFLLMGG